MTAGSLDTDGRWGDEVVETEVLGRPCRTFARRPRHLSELHFDARRFAQREYLVQGKRRLTFAEHERAINAIARFLWHQGVRPRDRVMILGANAIEWVVAFWAGLRSDAIAVLGNAWWSPREVAGAIEATAPSLVIADGRRRPNVPSGPLVVRFEEVAHLIKESDQGPQPGRDVAVTAHEDDPAMVIFTSGTTGPPRGAVLTHRGILATLQSLMLLTGRLPSKRTTEPLPSKALLSLPLFHIGGLQQVLNPLVTGGTLVFSEGRFDPSRIIALLEDEEINVWSAVPTMVSRVIDQLGVENRPAITSLRTLGMGGSPVPEDLRRRAQRAFPSTARGVAVTYGLTEAGGVVSTAAGQSVLSRPGCVGQPLPVTSIRIDNPAADGSGEVLVRSPSVMVGYWGAGRDSPIDDERWLHTGDIGRLDEDGYLYITDRSKDIVIRGGENVASTHVEERLLEHPAVREVAVIGLPHHELGEEVAAAVVLRSGVTATAEELAAFARQALAYYAVPSRWWLRDELLPKNPVGKIVKPMIREYWLAHAAETIYTGS